MVKIIKTNISVLLPLFIMIILFWSIWLPGPRVSTDSPIWWPDELRLLLTVPQTWRNTLGADGLGQDVTNTLWLAPMVMVYSVLSKLGIDYVITSKVIGVLAILIISLLSIDRLLRCYNLTKSSRIVGNLFFLLNTYLLLLIDGGQIFVALAYAASPLVISLFIDFVKKPITKLFIFFILSCIVLSIFDLRIAALVGFVCVGYVVFGLLNHEIDRRAFRRIVILFGITFLSIVLFHLYWIVPTVLNRQESITFLSSLTNSDVPLFSRLTNSFTLLQPHWPKNIFGQLIAIYPPFILIPLIAFSSLLKAKRDKNILFWALVAITAVFLGKGSNPPFGILYSWIINNISVFILFRDPTKFYVLISLSYSIMFAYTTQFLQNYVKNNNKLLSKLIAPTIIIFLILTVRPVWLGQMYGFFSNPTYQQEYNELSMYFEYDKDFGRILWVPRSNPLSYSSSKHPKIQGYSLSQMRPFALGRFGEYETYNFLRDSDFVGELLDITGISHVAYPYPDPLREPLKDDQKIYRHVFLDQLINSYWSNGMVNPDPLAVIETKSSQDHFFVTPNTYYVIGSDSIYEKFGTDMKLRDNALIFVEEGLREFDLNSLTDTIILNDKTLIDAAVLFAKPKLIFPADNLNHDPDNQGWWKRDTKDFVSWREFLENKYSIANTDFEFGGGWAVAEGNLSKTVENREEGMLTIRALESHLGGEVVVTQNGTEIGRINTRVENPENIIRTLKDADTHSEKNYEYYDSNVRWFEIGYINSDQFEIKTVGDINVINAYSITPENIWNDAKLNVQDKIEKGEIIQNPDLVNKNLEIPSISYAMKSPTKYTVTANNINKSSTLVFSEMYNSSWYMNDQESFPVYSILNGFTIDRDGVYEVHYKPQSLVTPSLVIGWGLFTVIMIILYKKGDKLFK